jgi:hypothetical protein
MPKIDTSLAKADVAEVLAILSSYTQEKIVELIDYSEDTNLQLVSLLSPTHKDTLSYRLVQKFPFLDQQDLLNKLFEEIKTVEKLIEYVVDKS